METRLTLRQGQHGTRKLVIESVPWNAKARKPRRRDDDVVYERIAYHETDLRERAKPLGAIWRQPQKLWEITFRDGKRLGIADRIVESG
jgi:hypothetical protein